VGQIEGSIRVCLFYQETVSKNGVAELEVLPDITPVHFRVIDRADHACRYGPASRTADTHREGEPPQGEEQVGGNDSSTGVPLNDFAGMNKSGKVEFVDEGPDDSDGMVGGELLIEETAEPVVRSGSR